MRLYGTRSRGRWNLLRVPLLGTGFCIVGAWFWSTGATRNSQPDDAQPTAEAVAAATPTPRPTPHPTPNPFIEAHKIPAWAQSRVIEHVPVRPGEKVIALTFDDGPWPEYTEQILRILSEHKVKATFYMVGQVLREYPRIGKKVRDAGHAVGSHSWSHPLQPRDGASQIKKTDAAIKSILGFEPTTFRPPYGNLKSGMVRQAKKERQAILMWSADSSDWKRPSAARMTATVLRQASPGGIILMHDGGGNRRNTVAALRPIIETLHRRGYRFVTVPQLLRMRYVPPPKAQTTGKTKKTANAKPPQKPSKT